MSVTRVALDTLADVLEVRASGPITREGLEIISAAFEADLSLQTTWLVLAVVGRALPTEAEVRQSYRLAKTEGVRGFVERCAAAGRKRSRAVEILRDMTVVDVAHTATTDLATGIQRVARETVSRWHAGQDVTLVAWTADGTAMRRLVPAELDTALHAAKPIVVPTRVADSSIVVPFGGIYLLPELAAESWRAPRLSALAQFAGLTSCVIGFDCVPLTTAETVGLGMPGAFAGNLGAVAHMSKVGTISEAAAVEYSGWREMLAPTGIKGPDVRSVLLAAEPYAATEADLGDFAEVAGLDDLPLVLVVGSHEPRKNHLAVLQAAEILWRDGLEFRLVFVGGNSWNSLDFTDRVEMLKAAGRPITTLSALADRLLWAGYRSARFTVFPSVNEGFGLPIAESVSCGTPVVTSDYGSMREIGAGNGALLVDSHNDDAVAAGMRSLLVDDALFVNLKREAEAYRVRTWDDYAAELWDYFTSAGK